MTETAPLKMPKLLASTRAAPDDREGKRYERPKSKDPKRCKYTNFKKAVWTADGTSIITDSVDKRIRTFIVPPDLLEERESELPLDAFSQIQHVEAVRAFTPYPLFNLEDPATALVLSSVPDHPVQLHSALSDQLVASYPLVHGTTEAFLSPHALTFSPDGQNFVVGSKSALAIFDVARPGAPPASGIIQTAPRQRTGNMGTSIGMKGIISALSIEPSTNILAAGTFSRHVSLYSSSGQGQSLGVFTLAQNLADCRIGGQGITQLLWSPSGRYLYIVERRSHGVMVYDIRKTGQLVSWTEGRDANTNQRLSVDLSSTSGGDDGLEIWAGGVDGTIRTWRNTHCQDGGQQPYREWHAHDDTVSATLVHRSGSVVASCSGQRHYEDNTYGSSESCTDSSSDLSTVTSRVYDNSLRVWAV